MRTRQLLLLLTLLLVCGTTQAQETDPAWLEVADIALRLRSGPSTDDAIITQLTPREAVELLERSEEWSQIRRQDGLTGWAHNDYLLPFDERNRLDTHRRIGERRLFRVYGGQQRYGDLRVVGDYSYIYTVARLADSILPTEQDLQELSRIFDKRIYQQALDLWGVDDPPDIGGDERIVILVASGFDISGKAGGWYSGRHDMPHEPGPSGTGYLGIALLGRNPYETFSIPGKSFVLAHEFGHLLHDHVGGHNLARWVQESLATFTAHFLIYEHDLDGDREFRVIGASGAPSIQLNVWGSDYPGYLFMLYLYERLGVEMLRDFAAHPRQGLAALDDLLADHGDGMDADSFFADWVLANHLNDGQREDGRFGYRMLQDKTRRAQSAPSNRIRQLPVGIRASTAPYSADYYELPLPQGSASAERLLIDFRLSAPAPQDAWLQLVQVLPDRIDVQRFRASEHQGRPVLASPEQQPQRIFIAVSPFGARRRTQPVAYSFALRAQPAPADAQAQVITTLNLRSEPEIADNILGKLQRCSLAQVLQRGAEWSQVRNADGLTGWSNNDFLVHLNAPSGGGVAGSCAALVRAARNGDLGAVRQLLATGHPVNGTDAFGRSALHEAALWGHDAIITTLLRAGADIHVEDSAGRTSFDEALRTGNAGGLRLLSEADADLELSGLAGLPLMIDAAGQGNMALLELLLAEGHDVNWQDENGRTALAAAAANGHDAMLRQLLAAGADTQWQDNAGRSPLMLAAAGGHLGVLGILHKTDADVNRQDREGHSALTLAAANGHALSVAWLLLSSSVDVHHTLPASGRNALHLAAAAGHADVVAMLMLADIDVHAEDADGHTALQLAGAGGHDRATRYLRMPDPEKARPRGGLTEAEIADFLAAAQSGNLAETDRLLAAATEAGWRGQPLLVTDEEGLTALMLAARAGHRDVALRLLLAGANPDIRENIGWDEPALFFTIRDGYDDLSALLLLAGAHPLATLNASPNVSALHWAADFGREDVVHLLLNLRDARRISVNARGFSGWTPLFQAVFSGHANIVRILLAAGADPDARARNVRFMGSASSLEYARAAGNQTIINLLLKAGAEA